MYSHQSNNSNNNTKKILGGINKAITLHLRILIAP